MSQISANVNANGTPVYADIVKFQLHKDSIEMVRDWKNWSLKDIIRVLKDMVKDESAYGIAGVEVGNIVFYKLLEAAADPNVPFELIEKTLHAALELPAFLKPRSVFHAFYSISIKNRKAVCNFFKGFVKHGIRDALYYDLIYKMLTYRLNEGYPLGFQMSREDGFNNEVLAKLPPEMQEELKGASFYEDDRESDRRTVYSLLTGASIAM